MMWNVCGLDGLQSCPVVLNGGVKLQCSLECYGGTFFGVVWIWLRGMELCVTFRAFCSFCIMWCSVSVMSVQLLRPDITTMVDWA